MITRHRFFAAAVASAVLFLTLVASPAPARAADDELRVVNRGKHVLSEIHATGTVAHLMFGDKSWGDNILGANLPPGAETTFNKGPKPATEAGCKQDMRFVYTDGYVQIATEINMCKIRTVTLRY